MNQQNITSSSVKEDPENFYEVLQKFFDILHVVDIERVKIVAYQPKGITRAWFDQWKRNRVEDAPIVSWVVFENSLMKCFIPHEL